MAKRYYESKGRQFESESRYKENHGGKMDSQTYHEPRRGSERGNVDGYEGPRYDVGTDPRKTERMQSEGMIHEDMRAIANLPQEVMIKPYPRTGPYLPEDLDDTIAGVDHQMDYDDNKRRMNFYPKKV